MKHIKKKSDKLGQKDARRTIQRKKSHSDKYKYKNKHFNKEHEFGDDREKLNKSASAREDGHIPAHSRINRDTTAGPSVRQLSLCQENAYQGLTPVVSLDCEMVGVGPKGRFSVLARISIVNFFGHVLLDEFVRPKERVTDYRSFVSGIYPENLVNAKSFEEVQLLVGKILKGKILVGHALTHDFKCLYHHHPKRSVRDTSKYGPFKRMFGGKTPSLKNLTDKLLNIKIQCGEHSSVVDAQAAMKLYCLVRKDWEGSLQGNRREHNPKQKRQEGKAMSQDEIFEIENVRKKFY